MKYCLRAVDKLGIRMERSNGRQWISFSTAIDECRFEIRPIVRNNQSLDSHHHMNPIDLIHSVMKGIRDFVDWPHTEIWGEHSFARRVHSNCRNLDRIECCCYCENRIISKRSWFQSKEVIQQDAELGNNATHYVISFHRNTQFKSHNIDVTNTTMAVCHRRHLFTHLKSIKFAITELCCGAKWQLKCCPLLIINFYNRNCEREREQNEDDEEE